MARPSILGNHPPTEAEVNHALECCKAIPHIREELLAMEQEMSDIKESLDKAESQNEQELYKFMLEEKEKKCQQKWESLEKLIRAILAIPHVNARAAVDGFYLKGNVDNERVFSKCLYCALAALSISVDALACFEPKLKSTDTVRRESVPKDYRMSAKAQKQYGLLMDILELCGIYY